MNSPRVMGRTVISGREFRPPAAASGAAPSLTISGRNRRDIRSEPESTPQCTRTGPGADPYRPGAETGLHLTSREVRTWSAYREGSGRSELLRGTGRRLRRSHGA